MTKQKDRPKDGHTYWDGDCLMQYSAKLGYYVFVKAKDK